MEVSSPDNGSAYRSTLHALACRALKVRHLRTPPYRPHTNGKTERFIRTLLRARGAPGSAGRPRPRRRRAPVDAPAPAAPVGRSPAPRRPLHPAVFPRAERACPRAEAPVQRTPSPAAIPDSVLVGPRRGRAARSAPRQPAPPGPTLRGPSRHAVRLCARSSVRTRPGRPPPGATKHGEHAFVGRPLAQSDTDALPARKRRDHPDRPRQQRGPAVGCAHGEIEDGWMDVSTVFADGQGGPATDGALL